MWSARFTKCIKQRSVEAPRLWLKITREKLWNVEQHWKDRQMGSHVQYGLEGSHQVRSSMFADHYWIVSHKKENADQMVDMVIETVHTGQRWVFLCHKKTWSSWIRRTVGTWKMTAMREDWKTMVYSECGWNMCSDWRKSRMGLAAQEQKRKICSMTFRFRVSGTVVHNVNKTE